MTRALVTSIETYSGLYLDYEHPSPDQIQIVDIARGLSQTARFAGQTTKFYSVAEHAVAVSGLVLEGGAGNLLALAALHHDSHEAYLCDWPSPLKTVIGEQVFDELCDGIDEAIAHVLGFPVEWFHHDAIKRADMKMLRREAATLKWSHGVGPHWGFEDALVPLAGIGWNPDKAEREFMWAHAELSR